jgi:putative peptide zinc metalloprotease protein
VTGRITAPFKWLFRPWIVLPALLGFAVVLWFVLIHEGVAPATAQAFDKPELLLLILGLTVASAAFTRSGTRPPAATAVASPAAWAPASTSSGPPSTPT